jgi:hypothetical protein
VQTHSPATQQIQQKQPPGSASICPYRPTWVQPWQVLLLLLLLYISTRRKLIPAIGLVLSSWRWTFWSIDVSTSTHRSGICIPCSGWTSQRFSSTHSIHPGITTDTHSKPRKSHNPWKIS